MLKQVVYVTRHRCVLDGLYFQLLYDSKLPYSEKIKQVKISETGN
jgi:hypothetical protein